MDQLELHEFAKNSENKEGSDFDQAKQEAGILQGDLIVSKLYNTMLGAITRVMRSWDAELTKVLTEAGITPSALTNEQLFAALKVLIRNYNSGVQIGDLIPNISNVPPAGRMICDGTWINNCNTLFPEFYQFILSKAPYVTAAEYTTQLSTYGQCGFCAVDGNNVRLPTITRPISGVSNLNQTGQAILDTMRPITGKAGTQPGIDGTYRLEGALTTDAGNVRVDKGSSNGWNYPNLVLNSALLGPRYNGSETRGKQVQYPYAVQVYTAAMENSMANVAELVALLKEQAQLGIQDLPASTGNIELASGGIYRGTVTGSVTFVLPTVQDNNLLNQILVQLTISAGASIDWGTSCYMVDEPLQDAGSYNIVYEYDSVQQEWFVGQVIKVQ